MRSEDENERENEPTVNTRRTVAQLKAACIQDTIRATIEGSVYAESKGARRAVALRLRALWEELAEVDG